VVIKPHNPPPPRQATSPPAATPTTGMPWCTFHCSSTHSTADYRALKYSRTHKTLHIDTTTPPVPTPMTINPIPLPNPTKLDPSFSIMTSTSSDLTPSTLFTHNCQIKHIITTLILDNGSQTSLVAQNLVDWLQLPTTPHLAPYQLGWVQKDGPRLTVFQRCVVTFFIGAFRDTVICDVSPLDCVDLIL